MHFKHAAGNSAGQQKGAGSMVYDRHATLSVKQEQKRFATREMARETGKIRKGRERLLFLTFEKRVHKGNVQWQAQRYLPDSGATLIYIVERGSKVFPAENNETWVAVSKLVISRQAKKKIIVVKLIAKTLMEFGKERAVRFENVNKENAVLPRWISFERNNGHLVKCVPVFSGLQPTKENCCWKVRETRMLKYEDGGRFQTIAVKLVEPIHTPDTSLSRS